MGVAPGALGVDVTLVPLGALVALGVPGERVGVALGVPGALVALGVPGVGVLVAFDGRIVVALGVDVAPVGSVSERRTRALIGVGVAVRVPCGTGTDVLRFLVDRT